MLAINIIPSQHDKATIEYSREVILQIRGSEKCPDVHTFDINTTCFLLAWFSALEQTASNPLRWKKYQNPGLPPSKTSVKKTGKARQSIELRSVSGTVHKRSSIVGLIASHIRSFVHGPEETSQSKPRVFTSFDGVVLEVYNAWKVARNNLWYHRSSRSSSH